MRIYVIASLLIIAALAAIAYKGGLPANDWRIPYLSELTSALLVGGILSILFRVFETRESESTLRRLLRIHDSVDELGLKEILPESQGFNYTSMIEDPDTLSIVMNDGHRWVGNNAVSLKKRFSKRGTVTEVFLVDPDGPFVASLADKTEATTQDLSKKIHETWKRLGELYAHSERKGSLTIYRLRTYPTKALFLSEHLLVETPYQIASGRTNVPVYIYGKVAREDAPFWFATRDLGHLREESKVEIKYPTNGA